MAKKTDTLVVKLETDGAGNVKASIAGVSTELDNLDKSSKKTNTSLLEFKKIIGGLAIGAIAKELLTTADNYNVLQQRIKTATKATQDYAEVSAKLFDISIQNGTQLETTISLFQNLARTAPELDATNEQILELVNSVQQLGVISAASQSNLDAGLQQFSQGLSAGVLRAEEFNSLLDNIPEVTARIAKGLGVTTGQLRAAVLEGKVLSRDVFNSLLSQAPEISKEFNEIPDSLQRSGVAFTNALTLAIARLDEATGITSFITKALAGATYLLRDNTDVERLQKELDELNNKREILELSLADSTTLAEKFSIPVENFLKSSSELNAELGDINSKIAETESLILKAAGWDEPLKSDAPGDLAGKFNALAEETNGFYDALDLVDKQFKKMEQDALEIELGIKLPASVIEELRQLDELAERIAATNTTYTERARELHDELERGALTYDEYAKEMDRLDEGDFGKLADSGEEAMQRLEAAARGWGEEFTNTMAEMVQSGKLSFSDLADSIIADLLRIMIYQNITAPILGGLGLVPAPTAHTGGIVGSTSGSTFVNPMAFAGAQRFHTGGMVGLGPNEVPIIANKGEEVLTENDPRHRNNMSGGDIKVEVIKNGSPVEVDSANARTDINGTVISIIMNDYNRGGQMRRLIDGGQK